MGLAGFPEQRCVSLAEANGTQARSSSCLLFSSVAVLKLCVGVEVCHRAGWSRAPLSRSGCPLQPTPGCGAGQSRSLGQRWAGGSSPLLATGAAVAVGSQLLLGRSNGKPSLPGGSSLCHHLPACSWLWLCPGSGPAPRPPQSWLPFPGSLLPVLKAMLCPSELGRSGVTAGSSPCCPGGWLRRAEESHCWLTLRQASPAWVFG